MPFDDVMKELNDHLAKGQEALDKEFKRIRTGRASPSMIDHVKVDAYGSPMPVSQVATVTVPEPAQILIKPWDKNLLHAIEKALVTADLGMSPQNDGNVIRLNLPPLSAERRKELAAQAKELAEKCKVSLRGHRRDAIKRIETVGKEQKHPEDEIRTSADKVSKVLKDAEAKVEATLKAKVDSIITM